MAHAGSSADISTAPRLAPGLRLNLSLMMFLQFAVWGAWFVVLGVYLEKGLGFTGAQIGNIYGTMALGTIFAPMFIGQIADRYFSSEKLMAILHLAGAGLLYAMAQTRDPGQFYIAALIYALVYSPTLVLSNSITFSHVPNGARDFPSIRVMGTIGWIVANLIVGTVLPFFFTKPDQTNLPLLLAAGFSAVLGVTSFFLPHTPPAGKKGDAFPALRAVALLKSPSFAVFFGVSFVITIVLAFYYSFTGNYLNDSTLTQVPKELNLGAFKIGMTVATVMTIGQFAEMLLLPFLPWFLRVFGMKWVLALGMLAWGLRYMLFSLGAVGLVSPWVVIASLALHGICFDFFFAAGFIYVDNEAPKDIRASGQALFTFLTYGVGMWLGNIVSGVVVDHYSLWHRAGGEVVWKKAVDDYAVAVDKTKFGSLSPDFREERDRLQTDEGKKELLTEISMVTGGPLKFDEKDKKVALAALGSTNTDFKSIHELLETALEGSLKDSQGVTEDWRIAYDILKAEHETVLWKREVDQLKKDDVPADEWPKKPAGPPTTRDWHNIWRVPSIGVLASLVAFLLFFHIRPKEQQAQALPPSATEPWKMPDSDKLAILPVQPEKIVPPPADIS